MEPEYPKYDEQIYNVVDQTLDATKQEDVVLAEKEFKEKRKSIFHELRNKDIKKIWHSFGFIHKTITDTYYIKRPKI